MMQNRQPIKFCSFGGYRRFCSAWWKDLFWYLTRGWFFDIRTYWLRARYGWAPKDVWSLDTYLETVLAGALYRLSEKTYGTPYGYPNLNPPAFVTSTEEDTNHELWRADLARWSQAFADNTRDDFVELYCTKDGTGLWGSGHCDYDKWNADQEERRQRMLAALNEMLPWWESLWD
jgi:hypothetical protein